MITAAEVTDEPNDYGQLSAMLAVVEESLTQAGIDDRPEVVIADAGYFDTKDIAGVEDTEDKPLLLVATTKTGVQHTDPGQDPAEPHRKAKQQKAAEEHHERLRRAEILRRWSEGEINISEAADEMGVGHSRLHQLRQAWRNGGADAITVPKRQTAVGPPLRSKTIRYLLETRLADPANRELYKQRGHIAETPFARIKEHQKLRRFARRGIDAVNADFLLDCIVHNLLRLRALPAA